MSRSRSRSSDPDPPGRQIVGWDLGVLLDAAGLLGDEYGRRDRSHVTGVSDFGRYEHERGRRRARCCRRPRARGPAKRPSSGRAGRLRPADRRCAVRVAGPRRSPPASRRRRPEADRARRRARGRLLSGVRRRLPRRLLAGACRGASATRSRWPSRPPTSCCRPAAPAASRSAPGPCGASGCRRSASGEGPSPSF